MSLKLPDINELVSKYGNRYELIMLASIRARELIEGARPLVRINSRKPLNIALAEIAAGRIKAERTPASTEVEEIKSGENLQNLLGGEL